MAEKWGYLKDESSHILYLTDISATLLLLLLGESYILGQDNHMCFSDSGNLALAIK